MRKSLSYAFSARALEEQEMIVAAYIDRLLDGMKGERAKGADVVEWFECLSFDVVGDLALGELMDSLRGGKYLFFFYHFWFI